MITLSCSEYSIQLPNPILGDVENGKSSTIVKETMDGRYRTYVKNKTNTVLNYTFKSVKSSVVDDLIEFLENSAGKIVTLIDYNDTTYSVYITNSPFELSYNHRGEYADFSMEMVEASNA